MYTNSFTELIIFQKIERKDLFMLSAPKELGIFQKKDINLINNLTQTAMKKSRIKIDKRKEELMKKAD